MHCIWSLENKYPTITPCLEDEISHQLLCGYECIAGYQEASMQYATEQLNAIHDSMINYIWCELEPHRGCFQKDSVGMLDDCTSGIKKVATWNLHWIVWNAFDA